MENENQLCRHLTGIGIAHRRDVCAIGLAASPSKSAASRIDVPLDSFFTGGRQNMEKIVGLCTAVDDPKEQLVCDCFCWASDEARQRWEAQARSDFQEG